MSIVHPALSWAPEIISSASYRFSPLKVNGAVMLYPKEYSVQSLCFPITYRAAVSALTPADVPPMFSGLISPNMMTSRSAAMMCSSVAVRVPFLMSVSRLRTRHTVPAPGSVSSCSQSPTAISGLSGPITIVAVPSRSVITGAKLTGLNPCFGSRLWVSSRIIYLYLPYRLTVPVMSSSAVIRIWLLPGAAFRSLALSGVRLSIAVR